jgi:hypothetical protein
MEARLAGRTSLVESRSRLPISCLLQSSPLSYQLRDNQ